MAVDYKKTKVVFHDLVSIEEAEGLVGWLGENPSAKVDLTDCGHVHPSVLQVLAAAGTRVSAWPRDLNLKAWLETLLPAARSGGDHG